MTQDDRLGELRRQIDAIDGDLLRLLSERARCAQQVAEVKQTAGETAFYRPEREAQVLRRVVADNPGPLTADAVTHIFREIMSACLALERPLTVAYLGPPGTFSQDATHKHFGQAVSNLPQATIEQVFREVDAGAADYGVVPIENSTEGAVTHTLDMFMTSPLKVCGEVELAVHQQLLSREAELASVGVVYSHAQSLAQCRRWLAGHLPGVRTEAVSSNAEAARRAAGEAGAAAIAGESAGRLYDLSRLAANIEDEPGNTTRFLVIGKQDTQPSGRDKTSLLLSTGNRPGALAGLLEPLRRHGVSMTRIESRPARTGRWQYVFFVDIEGHALDTPVQQVLAELREVAALCKVLGAYPRAIQELS
jgi:chorismate mutase/prephenate dehydratase